MANYISIDQSKRLGLKLRRLVDLQREALDLAKSLKAIMEEQIDNGDYSGVEAQFGVAEGKGQTTYNLVAGALTEIDVSAVNQMLNWLG